MRDKTRFYTNSKGEKVPSGTSVLPKPYLAQWAANCAVDYLWENSPKWPIDGNDNTVLALRQDVMDKVRTAFEQESREAADYGTYIHTLCEYSLKNGIQLASPHKMTGMFMAGFWVWCYKHKVKVITMEHEVVTDTYGGRLDLVCEMDGVVTIVDFKTGKGTYYDTWKWQLAGYRQAWNDTVMNKGVIQNSVVVKFNKETMKVNWKSFNEYQATRTNLKGEKEKYTRTYDMDRGAFNDCVRLWWSTQRGMEI